jgi:group I intron endonuclease
MIIYKVTNLVNGKVYIGLTTQTLTKRKNNHLCEAFSLESDYVFHRALRKYGKENFSWEVIDNANTLEELKEKEKYWILYYNSYIHSDNSNGYNMTIGGEGNNGLKLSDETKKKLSELHKGKKASEESKKKLSEAFRGSNHPLSKLTEDDVLVIKELIKNGVSQTEIAKNFNIERSAIYAIKSGQNWSHVGENISNIETNGNAKLTYDDVVEIKNLLSKGVKQTEISEMFNITQGAVSFIKRGETWSDVGIDVSNIEYSMIRNSKLNEENVKQIKLFLKEGKMTLSQIAKLFDVTKSAISAISTGRRWGHVKVT